jgi:hypothetical protein
MLLTNSLKLSLESKSGATNNTPFSFSGLKLQLVSNHGINNWYHCKQSIKPTIELNVDIMVVAGGIYLHV